MTTRPALHFVGFRGEEFWSAVRIFGRPDFFHIGWDLRAQREIAEGDVVVFAKGTEHDTPARHSYPDVIESDAPATHYRALSKPSMLSKRKT